MMNSPMLEHPFPFDPTYGYDLDALLNVGAPPDPPDLIPFWQATYQEALQVPPDTTQREIASARADLQVFEIEFDSWNGFRIGGWLTIPRDTPIQRGVVVGHGYGGRTEPDLYLPGPPAVAIFPCLRGQGRSTSPDISELAAGHVLTGIESHETYIHRGCTADLWCAASALIALFPEAASCLHYIGGSFGGGIGAMALPWDPRFQAGFLSVPSFGSHPLRVTLPCVGGGESVRGYYQTHPEVLKVLAYFDAATCARHLSIPMFCDCALFDPAVPPPGQFAVYNAIPDPKELFVHQTGHFPAPTEEEEGRLLYTRLDQWFRNLPSN